MTPLDRLLYRTPDPDLRLLFAAADRTAIEAASLASVRDLVTPVFLQSRDTVRAIAPDVDLSGFECLGFHDLLDAPATMVAERFVSERIVDGVVFGSEVDVESAADALGDGPVAATMFLEFITGEIVVLTADLGPDSVDVAEAYVREIMGPTVPVKRLDRGMIRSHGDVSNGSGVLFCEEPDRRFNMCDLLRRFANVCAYGAVLFGSTTPAVVLRPSSTTEDTLGSVALLATLMSSGKRSRSPRGVLPSSGARNLLH